MIDLSVKDDVAATKRTLSLQGGPCILVAHEPFAEISGASHVVYISRPKEVAALIEEAASHAH